MKEEEIKERLKGELMELFAKLTKEGQEEYLTGLLIRLCQPHCEFRDN